MFYVFCQSLLINSSTFNVHRCIHFILNVPFQYSKLNVCLWFVVYFFFSQFFFRGSFFVYYLEASLISHSCFTLSEYPPLFVLQGGKTAGFFFSLLSNSDTGAITFIWFVSSVENFRLPGV